MKTLKLVQIGNSKGIRIPKEWIQRYHLGEEVSVTETASGLLLQSARSKKLNLEASFEAMAAEAGSTVAEVEEWSGTLADGLDASDDFKSWHR